MAECERCGGVPKRAWVDEHTGTRIGLCSTCDAEFRDWLDQDGVYSPLWRADDG